MRAMSSRSITLGTEQELAIAIAAEDRGGHDSENIPAERSDGALHILGHGGMDLGGADDALLDMDPADFELRLDQGDEPRGRLCQSQGRRQNELERDEAHVDDHKGGPRREPARRKHVADVESPAYDISVEIRGDELALSIGDRGSGFPEEMMRRAFEPYVTTKAKGTGLGLAIVRKIVEEHRGRVTIENQPPRGALVTLYFPLEGAKT